MERQKRAGEDETRGPRADAVRSRLRAYTQPDAFTIHDPVAVNPAASTVNGKRLPAKASKTVKSKRLRAGIQYLHIYVQKATRPLAQKLSPPLRQLAAYLDPRSYQGAERVARSVALVVMAGLITFGVVAPVLNNLLVHSRYKLSDATTALVGKANPNLTAKISYDEQAQSYYFNKDGMDAAPATAKDPNDPQAVLKQLQAQVGGEGKKDDSLYSVQLPKDASKGITYYDNNSGLSFSMVPQFAGGAARQTTDDRLVYPDSAAQAVYTPKSNGLKEDLVLTKPQGDRLSFSYKLNLPKELEARLTSDGGLGVYSADPSLFGNISYGSDADKAAVMKARQDGEKNHLVFGIPAPVIKQTGKAGQGSAKADFFLDGDTLTVKAAGLQNLTYPVSIDPSVVITSSSDFAAGNNEGNIDFPSAQISRGGLTGGSVGSWTASASYVPTPRYGVADVAYNGYLYAIGGYDSFTEETGYLYDVLYASINAADGSISSWTATNSFSTGRRFVAAAAYNGYLYIMGGRNNAGYLQDVQYALICTGSNSGAGGCSSTPGTVGTWSTSSHSLPAVSAGGASFGNAGYLYFAGGFDGGTYSPAVYYAKLLASGDLAANSGCGSSWCATTSLGTGRSEFGFTAYNGYAYVMGGAYSSGTLNDVWMASIGTDGSLGTWQSLNTFTNARSGLAAAAYDGYLYIFGGSGSAYYADTQYAPIYANGTIGAWSSASNSFAYPRDQMGGAIYNGYLYITGGLKSASSSNCNSGFTTAYCMDTQYAKIDPAGVLGPSNTAGSTFNTVRAQASSVVTNGYIYIFGGCSVVSSITCSTATNTVRYNLINSDGSLGTWGNATAGLPVSLGTSAAVAYGGQVYVLTGHTSSTARTANVYYATPSLSGNITAWTTVSPTGLTARWGAAALPYNGYLYVFGGCSTASSSCTTFLNDAEYSQFVSGGGLASPAACANTFCPLTSFATGRYGLTAALNGDRVYLTGGSWTNTAATGSCTTASSIACNDIQYARLSSSGGLLSDGGCGSTWCTDSSSFSTSRFYHAVGISNGFMYISAGQSSVSNMLGDSQYARLTTSGALASDSGCGSTWCTASNVSIARGAPSYVMNGGTLYIMGGMQTSNTETATTYYASANNGGSGAAGTWTSNTALSAGRYDGCSVTYNGYIYAISGNLSSTSRSNWTTYAKVGSDGTLGTWTDAVAFSTNPTNVEQHACAAYNGYLYELGGYNGGFRTDVRYIPINADGSLGDSWLDATSLPTGLEKPSVAAYNGYLYVVGGASSTASATSTALYAQIAADGSLGSWQTTTSYPHNIKSASSFIGDGYLYLLGGTDGTNYQNDVQAALIKSDGTLGPWNSSTSFNMPRTDQVAEVYNGYVYVFGGKNQAGTTLNDVQYAPVNANGSVGSWETAPSFATARKNAMSAVSNGYLYIIDGQDSASNALADVQSASLSSIARSGRYSKLIDLGGTYTVASITYNGTLARGVQDISYRTAGSDGIFGSLQNAGSLTGGGATCLAGTDRYVWVTVNLDDSQDAVFPDAQAATTANLTDLTVNYLSAHPPPAQRLHGGKTLQSGTLSGLDTCGA